MDGSVPDVVFLLMLAYSPEPFPQGPAAWEHCQPGKEDSGLV